ncbi:MAG: cation:proton antiporter [Anaerolineae bacterium]|nr:cation:proton antiporter [Anaerolineae bacterium]
MDIFLLAALTCLVIVTIGNVVNRTLRLPWMFSVVVLGLVLSTLGLFETTMASANFRFLAQLGMLFFLFTLGLDLELTQIRKLGAYIVGGNILLTLTEGLVLALFVYFAFPQFVQHSFVVALIAGVAFGTVGEVVLLAILKEFGLERTRFGQLALGIGVFDDMFEILTLALIIALPAFLAGGATADVWQESALLVATLLGLIVGTLALTRLGPLSRRLLQRVPQDSFVMPFTIFMIAFAFIYAGSRQFENLGVVAAIFSGIAVKQLLPEKALAHYKKPIFFVGNIFLGPFFFLSLGGRMSFGALLTYPGLVLAIMAIALGVRMTLSYALFHKLLGKRESLALGVGLTSKFSMSVVSENLLFTAGLIAQPLYSTMMAAFILLKPIVAGVFSHEVARLQSRSVETAAPVPGPGQPVGVAVESDGVR